MSPNPPLSEDTREIDAAAKALVAAVAKSARDTQGEDAPARTLMSVALTALCGAVSDIDQEAPFAGIAGSLASMSIAQGITKHQVLSYLNAGMTPYFETPFAKKLLKARGKA